MRGARKEGREREREGGRKGERGMDGPGLCCLQAQGQGRRQGDRKNRKNRVSQLKGGGGARGEKRGRKGTGGACDCIALTGAVLCCVVPRSPPNPFLPAIWLCQVFSAVSL